MAQAAFVNGVRAPSTQVGGGRRAHNAAFPEGNGRRSESLQSHKQKRTAAESPQYSKAGASQQTYGEMGSKSVGEFTAQARASRAGQGDALSGDVSPVGVLSLAASLGESDVPRQSANSTQFELPSHLHPAKVRSQHPCDSTEGIAAAMSTLRAGNADQDTASPLRRQIVNTPEDSARFQGHSLVSHPPSLPLRAPCDTYGTATSARSPSQAAAGTFQFASQCPLPTMHGGFTMRVYVCSVSGKEAVVMLSPRLAQATGASTAVDPASAAPDTAGPATSIASATAQNSAANSASPAPLLRVHDACATSELFGSLKCDCKVQLDAAMRLVQADATGGAVVYLQQEGRGIGLANKVAAYALQQGCGADTVDANRALGLPDDVREYAAVRDILADLGVPSIRLLTNNPRKVALLEQLGVQVAQHVPLVVPPPSALAKSYLDTKVARMQHMA